MREIQRQYMHENASIDAYFITFDEMLTKPVIIDGDMIYIKGKERLVNIMYKTMASLRYIVEHLGKEYDYLVRTNVSTVLHYTNLLKYLQTATRENLYSGGKLTRLNWELATNEISERRQNQRNAYRGILYFQGIGIILSKDVVSRLLNVFDELEYEIVDDVSFGLMIRKYCPDAYKQIVSSPHPKTCFNEFQHGSVFVRHKTQSRDADVVAMRETVNDIIYRQK
jgi:hypothetical protein